MKILVTCHARAAITRAVADDVASALGADVDLIIPRRSTDGVIGWVRCAYDATFERSTDIALPARKLDAYDVVVIGSPTCNGALASPVRTYLERHRASLRAVALFTTCGARGGERALEQMARLCVRDPLARLALRDSDARSERGRIAIVEFAGRITARSSRPPVDGVGRLCECAGLDDANHRNPMGDTFVSGGGACMGRNHSLEILLNGSLTVRGASGGDRVATPHRAS